VKRVIGFNIAVKVASFLNPSLFPYWPLKEPIYDQALLEICSHYRIM